MRSLSKYLVSRLRVNLPVATGAVLLAIATGCAGNAAPKKAFAVSDADYGRLAAGQTTPVDEARAQLALASDELGRAKLAVVNLQHEGDLARSDQASASADASRAAAQTKIGKDSNEPGQIQQARDDTKAAQQNKAVADARVAYSKKLVDSQSAQIVAAERKVDLMTEKVNVAKLQALDDAAIPAAGKYDRATAMQRVAEAQRAYDGARSKAAAEAHETANAKARWQQLAQ
jgi:hypothetical protein